MEVSKEHFSETDDQTITIRRDASRTSNTADAKHECPSPRLFHSILFRNASDRVESREVPACFHDLHLGQLIDAITLNFKNYDLGPFFNSPLTELDAIVYRQEVMRDLEDDAAMKAVKAFSQAMSSMRDHLVRADKSYYPYEKERWFLDAVNLYCNAVERLRGALAAINLRSRGLQGFRDFLGQYTLSDSYKTLAANTRNLSHDLSSIRYDLWIQEGKCTVRQFNSEIDYSKAVEETFARFRRGAVKDYLAELSVHAGMNHIQAQILEGVSRLYPDVFASLKSFHAANGGYLDHTIACFDREIQFYVASLDYIARFRAAGLKFCFPELSAARKKIKCQNTFDIALAGKLVQEKKPVVTNNFSLCGAERIFVVSGPNQGGKTTFARTFGQVHYLARLGCPVPGTEAQLFLFDHLFTHFEREEDIQNLHGKLHDDLVRIRQILDRATPRSIVIMNELFSSTTLSDALFLSKKIMARISELDLLSVWVTFLTEMTTFNEKTVSVVSTVDPHDPAIRTFKLERKPAEGIAYALAVAEKHRVTYQQLKERIKP